MELRFGIPGGAPFLEQRGSLPGYFARPGQGTKRSVDLWSQHGPQREEDNDTEEWSEHRLAPSRPFAGARRCCLVRLLFSYLATRFQRSRRTFCPGYGRVVL